METRRLRSVSFPRVSSTGPEIIDCIYLYREMNEGRKKRRKERKEIGKS